MRNQDLFKQAIAEAKSVREAAIINAKEALEETLTPHLKELLAAKLQEMDEVADDEEVVNEIEDEMDEMAAKKGNFNAQTDATEDQLEEAEDKEAEDDSEESEDEAPAEEEGEEKAEEEEELEVKDMEVEDLKNLIRDIVAQEMGGQGEEEMPADDMDMDMDAESQPGDMSDDDTIDLEELLAELEQLAEAKGNEDEDKKKKGKKKKGEEEVNEFFWNKKEKPSAQPNSSSQRKCPEGQEMWTDGKCYPWEYFDYNYTGPTSSRTAPELVNGVIMYPHPNWANEAKAKEDLKEALATIQTLRSELSEVNLLNAKLLYLNKVFRANNLTESQKVTVITSFDKAVTVNEVKLVYETVKESFVNSKPKSTIKESKGFASAAAGHSTKPAVIEQVDEQVLRMQKLAGIIR
jgi:hypothetical protein